MALRIELKAKEIDFKSGGNGHVHRIMTIPDGLQSDWFARLIEVGDHDRVRLKLHLSDHFELDDVRDVPIHHNPPKGEFT